MIGSNLRFRRFFCVMNPHILTALGRERRRALKEDFAAGDVLGNGTRILVARVLRAAGEGLFRLGMALDERVTAEPIVETHIV
jgi:hypothetical protein